MNYLYFAEGAVETTGEAAMFPASAFLGVDPISATTSRVSFKARNITGVAPASDATLDIKFLSVRNQGPRGGQAGATGDEIIQDRDVVLVD